MKLSPILRPRENNGRGTVVTVIAIITILCLGLFFGLPNLNDFPTYIHAWAQSDWYALALGFQNNGYDFFHPETLLYNKQYPNIWCYDCGDAITPANMPLHGYIIALLMKLFGTTAPWVYRGWTLVCSIIGLWFLFLLCRRLTLSGWKALIVLLTALTSPLYVYYFANFLPSAPALALVMEGLWAYIYYWQEKKTGYWHLSIALLTLATLTRTSQAVALVAVCCFELIRIVRKETTLWSKVPAVAIGVMAIGGFLLWNKHLRLEHGSIFLNELMPPRSIEDIRLVWQHICESWKYSYFGRMQQWMLMAITLLALTIAILRKTTKKVQKTNTRQTPISLLLAIWTFGEILFVIALWSQFAYHDYYFLDSLWLPILIWLALALNPIPTPKSVLGIAATLTITVLIAGACFNEAKHTLKARHSGYDMASVCYHNYLGSDIWLDQQGVSRDAHIASVASYPQNSPLILMGRKGYSIMWFGADADVSVIARSARLFAADYFIIENYLVPDYFEQFSELLKYMQPVAENEHLTLCILSDTIVNTCANDFLQKRCN